MLGKRVCQAEENVLAHGELREIAYICVQLNKDMMNDRPLILITNDDGVKAKGIKELTECLRDLGDIVVFAPDGPRSGMASAITSLVPIRYTLVKKEKGLTVYSCTGTPVDCVKLAINEVPVSYTHLTLPTIA